MYVCVCAYDICLDIETWYYICFNENYIVVKCYHGHLWLTQRLCIQESNSSVVRS